MKIFSIHTFLLQYILTFVRAFDSVVLGRYFVEYRIRNALNKSVVREK